ncbi:MAG TPA: hypothetical protein VK961_17685 [Chthoniobacter sp.]|nr:hypothetical protein [Chthoniobacter sp.]
MSAVHFYCVLCGAALQTSAESRYDLLQCHACTRHVPVPRPAHGHGNFAAYPPVFPPEVLELSLKFQCAVCQAVLQTDARCEGREFACPQCGEETTIPCWSNMPHQGPARLESDPARRRSRQPSTRIEAPVLSEEELEFLRGVEPGKPEAAA